jgi:hypothetical protein
MQRVSGARQAAVSMHSLQQMLSLRMPSPPSTRVYVSLFPSSVLYLFPSHPSSPHAFEKPSRKPNPLSPASPVTFTRRAATNHTEGAQQNPHPLPCSLFSRSAVFHFIPSALRLLRLAYYPNTTFILFSRRFNQCRRLKPLFTDRTRQYQLGLQALPCRPRKPSQAPPPLP